MFCFSETRWKFYPLFIIEFMYSFDTFRFSWISCHFRYIVYRSSRLQNVLANSCQSHLEDCGSENNNLSHKYPANISEPEFWWQILFQCVPAVSMRPSLVRRITQFGSGTKLVVHNCTCVYRHLYPAKRSRKLRSASSIKLKWSSAKRPISSKSSLR